MMRRGSGAGNTLWRGLEWLLGHDTVGGSHARSAEYESLSTQEEGEGCDVEVAGPPVFSSAAASVVGLLRGLVTSPRRLTLLCLGLDVVTAVLYCLGLKAYPTEEELMDHIMRVAVPGLLAIALLVVQGFVLMLPAPLVSWRRKVALALLAALVVWCLFEADKGVRHFAHGYFNKFVTLLLLLPALAGLFVLLVISRFVRVSSIAKAIAAVFVVLLVWVLVRRPQATVEWRAGLFGRSLQIDWKGCSIPTSRDLLDWYAFLPKQNMFAGTDSCPPAPPSSASLQSQGPSGPVLLHIQCPGGQQASYFESPQLEQISFPGQVTYTFQQLFLEFLVFKEYTEPVPVTADLVVAQCGSNVDMRNFLTNHIRSDARAEQSKKQRAEVDKKVALLLEDTGPKVKLPRRPLNHVIIFVDAISRPMFFRRLPKSAERLTSIQQGGTSSVFQFFRYVSVGPNTKLNTRALYMGWIEDETDMATRTPTLWEEAHDLGYATVRTETSCQDWSFWERGTPTSYDHFLNWHACMPEFQDVDNPSNMFKGPSSVCRRCLGGEYVHRIPMRYSKDALQHYEPDTPVYMVNSFSEGHEGTSEVVALMDSDLDDYLHSLESLLDHTVVSIVADHGLHMGLMYISAEVGRLEHTMPTFFTIIPKWLLKENPSWERNLLANEQAVITGFDIHQYWRDILYYPLPAPPKSANKTFAPTRSLILDEIGQGRTCESLKIDKELCVCTP